MNTILIGNIVAFIGSIIMVLVGLIKSKKKILVTQCVQFSIQAVSNLILGGITGFISGIVSLIRNIIVYFKPLSKSLKILIILIQISIAYFTHPIGIISWFPIFAGCLFTWYIDLKDPIKFKIVIIICQFTWVIYDYTINNYVSCLFDIFTIISTIIGILRIINDKKKGITNFD